MDLSFIKDPSYDSGMDWLLQLDHELFHFINQVWTHPFLDELMAFITTFAKMWPVFVAVLLYAWWKSSRRVLRTLVSVLVAVGGADFTASHIIKPLVRRERPSYALGDSAVRLIVPKQSSPSFPSNHATNMFAVATMGTSLLPELAVLLWPLALLVAYSRVYVGVHFPLDVLGGALYGSFIALLLRRIGLALSGRYWEMRRSRPRRIPRRVPKKPRA